MRDLTWIIPFFFVFVLYHQEELLSVLSQGRPLKRAELGGGSLTEEDVLDKVHL